MATKLPRCEDDDDVFTLLKEAYNMIGHWTIGAIIPATDLHRLRRICRAIDRWARNELGE